MGALGNALRAALTPVARGLVADVALHTVMVRRAVVTRAPDGSEERTWEVLAGAASVAAPIMDLDRESAEREWGIEPRVTAVVVLPDSLAVEIGDDVTAIAGPRIAERFRVAGIRAAYMAGLSRIALRSTVD